MEGIYFCYRCHVKDQVKNKINIYRFILFRKDFLRKYSAWIYFNILHKQNTVITGYKRSDIVNGMSHAIYIYLRNNFVFLSEDQTAFNDLLLILEGMTLRHNRWITSCLNFMPTSCRVFIVPTPRFLFHLGCSPHCVWSVGLHIPMFGPLILLPPSSRHSL